MSGQHTLAPDSVEVRVACAIADRLEELTGVVIKASTSDDIARCVLADLSQGLADVLTGAKLTRAAREVLLTFPNIKQSDRAATLIRAAIAKATGAA